MPTTTLQISNSNDDGTRFNNFADLLYFGNFTTVGYAGASIDRQGVGLRFQNVPIPRGAVINSATLTVTSNSNNSNTTVNSRISAYDADDTGSVIDVADYNSKFAAKTTAQVDWDNVPAFVTDTEYTSPEFKEVIAEVTSRIGWQAGNSILIFWEDHEGRTTQSNDTDRDIYDYGSTPGKAAKLNLNYTAGRIFNPFTI